MSAAGKVSQPKPDQTAVVFLPAAPSTTCGVASSPPGPTSRFTVAALANLRTGRPMSPCFLGQPSFGDCQIFPPENGQCVKVAASDPARRRSWPPASGRWCPCPAGSRAGRRNPPGSPDRRTGGVFQRGQGLPGREEAEGRGAGLSTIIRYSSSKVDPAAPAPPARGGVFLFRKGKQQVLSLPERRRWPARARCPAAPARETWPVRTARWTCPALSWPPDGRSARPTPPGSSAEASGMVSPPFF